VYTDLETVRAYYIRIQRMCIKYDTRVERVKIYGRRRMWTDDPGQRSSCSAGERNRRKRVADVCSFFGTIFRGVLPVERKRHSAKHKSRSRTEHFVVSLERRIGKRERS